MKALSIRQPWAWLILNGYKDVENRRWQTKFRGKFLVHAGKKFDHEGYRRVLSEMKIDIPEPREFEMGGIVGIAEIVDCITASDSPWFTGKYGFVLRNTRPLNFIPIRGQLGFFNVDDDLIEKCARTHLKARPSRT